MTESSPLMPVLDEQTVKLTKPRGPITIQKRGSVFTVILRPHNTQFQTRNLELRDKGHIRIGRQTSQKTTPTPYNGYFDSKVLSRSHAEIWMDKSKVYIKDVKSSNGTFVNGVRLSNECEESEPMELKTHDVIEFGIDIMGDNGAIMYHKVSCSVHVFPVPLSQVDDGIIKELSNQSVFSDPHHKLSRKSSTSSINTLSSISTEVNGFPASETNNKRLRKLDSVLNKLQAELDKSRQVETELKSIKAAVMDLDKVFDEEKMKKSEEVAMKLNHAELRIKSFDQKWKHQHQAIQTAKNELLVLGKQSERQRLDYQSLNQDLERERKRNKTLEQELHYLKQQRQEKMNFSNAMGIISIQFMFATLVCVISTLCYVLYN